MNRELNNVIRRKNYQNFLINGEQIMNYRISNELANRAKQIIETDEINETINVLKNQISFLGDYSDNNTALTDEENTTIKENIKKLNNGIDVLNFQKQTLELSMEKSLENMNIKEAVNLKTKLHEVDKKLNDINQQK